MEVLQFIEGIVERSPVIRGTDHQGWKIEHVGPFSLQQDPGFSLLVRGAGHDHGAVDQWGAQMIGSASSFTRP